MDTITHVIAYGLVAVLVLGLATLIFGGICHVLGIGKISFKDRDGYNR